MSIDHRTEEQIANDEYQRFLKVCVIFVLLVVVAVAVNIIYLRGPAGGAVELVVFTAGIAFIVYAPKRMLRRYGAYHKRQIAEARRRLAETDWKKKDEHVQPVNREKENPNGQ